MHDRNAKSVCILKKLGALVFESICERTTKFHEKILLISKLLIFKHRRQNIPASNTALLTAVTCLERRCVVKTRSMFSRSLVMVAVSSLGHTNLFFIDQGTKMNGQYYRDVLFHQQLLPAICDLPGDFTFQ